MKVLLWLAALALSTTAALAQVAPGDEPGREAARFETKAPAQAQAGDTISLPGVVAPAGAGAITLHVKDIRFEGGTVYEDAELAALYTSLTGREITLSELYDLAQRITAKYGEDGYVLSRAIIPPQELDPKGAVVTIQLVEGYIDRVAWPKTTARYRDFFSEYGEKIVAARPANIDTVMRYLLLASDLPGIDVTSRFEASETNPNASTLVVEMTEKPVEGYLSLDNRGTEARGPWQMSGGATFNNLFGQHEAFTLGGAVAVPPKELEQIRFGYRQVLNSEGLFAFANASLSWGEPGTEVLETLAFNTNSLSFDAGLSFPVIRSRDLNLTLSGKLFLSNSQGEMLDTSSSDDRLRGFRLFADFDFADEWNGITQGNVTLSHGIVGLGSTDNDNPLASRENGRVDFTTLSASLSRVQEFSQGWSALTALSGQYAFTPLLSPEECGYGGRDFGRAFDPSELSGDSCVLVSGELRFDPDLPGVDLDLFQLYAFADYGRVFRLEPTIGTPDISEGASAGIGVRLGDEHWSTDLSVAKPLFGHDENGWRAFLTATAKY